MIEKLPQIVVIVVIVAAFVAWFGWDARCTRIGADQRRAMIDTWPTGSLDAYNRMMIMRAAYKMVTFEEHIRELRFGRDPFELYPADAFPIGDERRRGK